MVSAQALWDTFQHTLLWPCVLSRSMWPARLDWNVSLDTIALVKFPRGAHLDIAGYHVPHAQSPLHDSRVVTRRYQLLPSELGTK